MAEQMYKLHKRTYETDWTIFPNELLQNENLSWRGRAILCYLWSKPDNWELRIQDLINQGDCGRDAIRTVIKELETKHYLHRRVKQDAAGKYIGWDVFYGVEPDPDFTFISNRPPENPSVGFPVDILSKENTLSKESKKRKRIRTHWALRPGRNLISIIKRKMKTTRGAQPLEVIGK